MYKYVLHCAASPFFFLECVEMVDFYLAKLDLSLNLVFRIDCVCAQLLPVEMFSFLTFFFEGVASLRERDGAFLLPFSGSF